MLGDSLAWTPACPSCGCLVADKDAHQLFHQAIEAIWQEAFGLTDEEFRAMKAAIMPKLAAPSEAAQDATPGS
jgi:hypothetical protein